MRVRDIVQGHARELINKNESLRDNRIAICNNCVLFEKSLLGDVCSHKKYVDNNTGELVAFPCSNCTNGCGCRIEAKSRLEAAKCPLNKW